MHNLTKLLLGLFMIFSLASCGGGDDENTDDALNGTWKLVSAESEVQTTFVSSGETFTNIATTEFEDLDYSMTFEGSNFSTSGGYTTTTTLLVDGITIQTEPVTLTNVSGSGTYSVSGNQMTINGAFFDISYEGQMTTGASQAQTTDYEINANGQLVFEQDETVEQTVSGTTATSHVVSKSVWEKQ